MTSIHYFASLTYQVWGILFADSLFSVITFALLIGVIALWVRQNLLMRLPVRDRSWPAFGLLLFPWLILAIGTMGRIDAPREPGAFPWPVLFLYALMLLHVLAYALFMYLSGSIRLFLTCLFLFTGWVSLWASFVAAMSIHGDWL